MADYVMGDVQGCYDALMRLLDRVQFNEKSDRLWFAGDLVNRGKQSLEVLRFVKNLNCVPRVVLGNHDLHLLYLLYTPKPRMNPDDTLDSILKANDRYELGHWLRHQSILFYDQTLNVAMTHAGLPPMWDLMEAIQYANELTDFLHGDSFVEFLTNMYGNEGCWSKNLKGMLRLRVICNYFTRMRFCDTHGHLALQYKGSRSKAPPDLYPWFTTPKRKPIDANIVFGHWAALEGECEVPGIYALDTGCV